MLLDLISQTNYSSYNITIANMFGLEIAVYLNVILDINSKAIKKKKISNSYFTVDREYIKQITTIDEDKQKEIDKKLIKLGIIENTDKNNMISLNISVLTSMIMAEDEKLVSDISKIVRSRSSTKTKKEYEMLALKDYVKTNNEELKNAYYDWIESVFAKQGWMSKKSITQGQELVDNFSNHNLDIALTILEIASISGYRDINWAINRYKDNYNILYKTDLTQENIKSAKDSSINFTGDVF